MKIILICHQILHLCVLIRLKSLLKQVLIQSYLEIENIFEGCESGEFLSINVIFNIVFNLVITN